MNAGHVVVRLRSSAGGRPWSCRDQPVVLGTVWGTASIPDLSESAPCLPIQQWPAREQAAASELEGHRRSAWLNHRVEVALANGNEAFHALLRQEDMLAGIPSGWPPGDSAENYHVVGLPAPAPVDDVSGTLLGQALARAGVKI